MVSVKLLVRGGVNAGREIQLPGPKFLVGRADDCHLRPNSDLVSRHHCVVLVEDDFVSVRDFGSKNGTLVNDERVVGECELTHGCKLKIGPLEFDVSIQQAVAKKKRPKVQSIKEAAARSAEGLAEADDVDISEWIDDSQEQPRRAPPPPADAPTAMDETQTIQDSATEEINLGQTIMGAPGDSEGDEISSDQPTQEMKPQKRKGPGKLPPLPKSAGVDSGSAAADTLRKLFNRR